MTSYTTLRVLLMPSAYYPNVGGIEEITHQLGLELTELGHRAMIIVNRWPADTPSREETDGLQVRRLRFELPGASARPAVRFVRHAPASTIALFGALHEFHPNVIHLIGAGPNAAYSALARHIARIPVVLTTQGEVQNDAFDGYARSLMLRVALRSLLRVTGAVTAPTRFTLERLKSSYRVSCPCSVIPNGVSVQRYAEAEAEPTRRPYVLTVARLVPQKALDVLLRAWADAGLTDHDLVIAGDGPLRQALEAEACRLNILDRTRFLGSVSSCRVASLMRGARLFVLPSRQEAFPLALLEAMAAGAPVVATTAGGIAEYASDGGNALLVRPDDPGAAARAITRLVEDVELRGRLVAAARATAAELSWTRIAREYIGLYRSLA